MTDIRKVIVISDLHAGSTYGIMPPNFHTKEGNEIGLNDVQKWYWECWEDCWKWAYELIGDEEWSVVLNGDMIDGYHHGTKEVWSNDESDHGIAAYHLLKDKISGATSIFLTEGTEVHTKGHEHALAYQLDSKGLNVVRPNATSGAWTTLRVEFGGTVCKFDHHIGTTARPYLEASQLSIAMGAERVEAARAGHRVPKVYGRAHRHKFGHFDDGYGMMFTTPPWQALTRFGRKVVPHAIPQAGFIILDWEGIDDGVPVLHKRLHTIKQPPIYHD